VTVFASLHFGSCRQLLAGVIQQGFHSVDDPGLPALHLGHGQCEDLPHWTDMLEDSPVQFVHPNLSLVCISPAKVEAPAAASIRMRAPAGQPFCEAA